MNRAIQEIHTANVIKPTEEQRNDNEKAMEERRDILVAAIEDHDEYTMRQRVQFDKRHVRQRVQWLNKEIDSETTQIQKLADRTRKIEIKKWIKSDMIAERRRKQKVRRAGSAPKRRLQKQQHRTSVCQART